MLVRIAYTRASDVMTVLAVRFFARVEDQGYEIILMVALEERLLMEMGDGTVARVSEMHAPEYYRLQPGVDEFHDQTSLAWARRSKCQCVDSIQLSKSRCSTNHINHGGYCLYWPCISSSS